MVDSNQNKNLSAKPLILLVEAEPIILKEQRAFLERTGLQVDIAVSGAEASNKFKQHVYALVILDANLPDMFGDQLGKHLREHEKSKGRARTPFILLGDYNDRRDREYGEAIADTYVVKSLFPHILENLIIDYLNIRPSQLAR